MEQTANWKQTTSALYKAVLIYTLAGILSSLFGFFSDITGAASTISSMMGGESGSSFGLWDILAIVATLAIIYGYWTFIQSLGRFHDLVNPADAPQIKTLRTTTILMIVAAVLSVIPVIKIAGGIIYLIAWIMLIVAYSKLKNSSTFPELARKGTSRLFLAMILEVIGWVLGFIPLIGSIFETIISIIAFILVILGWKAISESEEPVYE